MSAPFFTKYPPALRRSVFGARSVSPILPYRDSPAKMRNAAPVPGKNISISGTQDKYSMVLDAPHLRFCREGERGSYILKPCLSSDFMRHREAPANEFLCMQVMQRIFRVPTAACALCFFQNGAPAYITRRFDRTPEGAALKFEDFASLSGMHGGDSNRKYVGSYQEMAQIIRDHSGIPAPDMETFFRLVLGNFLLCNGDAHLKNFGLLEAPSGEMRLSPAYDVLNTRLHVRQDALFAMEAGLFADGAPLPRQVGSHFRDWGRAIGIRATRVDAFIRRALDSCGEIEAMAHASYLSPPAQRAFLYEIRQRFMMLARFN